MLQKHPCQFFFENLYGVHSIKYNNLTDYIHLIAVCNDGLFTSFSYMGLVSENYKMPVVPKLFEGTVNSEENLESLINKFMKKPSIYGDEKEGIVIRPQGTFSFEDFDKNVFKYVREDHIQTDENWKKNWKKAELY